MCVLNGAFHRSVEDGGAESSPQVERRSRQGHGTCSEQRKTWVRSALAPHTWDPMPAASLNLHSITWEMCTGAHGIEGFIKISGIKTTEHSR